MDKTQRDEIRADIAAERERLHRKKDVVRARTRGPSMADLEDFYNTASEAIDAFAELADAVDAHMSRCTAGTAQFVSPTWEPCDMGPRSSQDPVSAWDCRMNGDLWTLEHAGDVWRLWGPVSTERTGVRDLSRSEISARHGAHDQIKDYYATGKR